jgi:hypothetical protein
MFSWNAPYIILQKITKFDISVEIVVGICKCSQLLNCDEKIYNSSCPAT